MQNFYELDGFEPKAEMKSILAHVDCYEDSPVYEMMREEYEDIIDEMMQLAKPVGIVGFGKLPESAATDDYKAGTPIIYGLCSIGGAISEQSTQAFADGEYVKGMLCDSIATNLLFSMEGRLLECLREICVEHKVGILRRLEAPHDLPMTIHAGEADGPESIKTALSFGTKRIGHGVAAIHDPELMKRLAEEKITLEICITSNYHTKEVETIADHPFRKLFEAGIRVTLNSDNMTCSRVDIHSELDILRTVFHFTEAEIDQIMEYAYEARFLRDYIRE